MKTDRQLKREVLEELQYEPTVDASRIGITVHNNIVTLAGAVATYAEQVGATHAAERVSGVQAVVNEIRVELPSVDQRDDQDIAQAVVNALKWHVWVPHDAINVSVQKGWVTLEGAVDAKFQRDSADEAVRWLTGVKGLTNLITVNQSTINSLEAKTKIEDALRRTTEASTANINVEVDGNKVTLRGYVRSHAERSDAERVAWAAPGIEQVDDKLTIAP